MNFSLILGRMNITIDGLFHMNFGLILIGPFLNWHFYV